MSETSANSNVIKVTTLEPVPSEPQGRVNTVLKYRGEAVPVLSLAPSWRQGISARPEMETVVAESLTGAEYRVQRRPRPFWRLRYEAISREARESGYIRRVVQLGADLPVAAPFWPHRVELTAAADPGAASLAHQDTADTIWPDVRYGLLWWSALDWEVVELADPGAGTASELAEPLEMHWPAGASLVPLLGGWLDRGAGATHETDEMGVWMIEFLERPVEAVGVRNIGIPSCEFDLAEPEEVAWLIYVDDLRVGLDASIRPSCGVADFEVGVVWNNVVFAEYFAPDEDVAEHEGSIPGWNAGPINLTDNSDLS